MRTNNLDALRLVGALSVILGHAYHLLGRSTQVPFVLGYPVSTVGVVVFFTISGYLITASWSRKRDPVSYLTARGLRIFPGLVLVVLFSVFVLGPWMSSFSTADYFAMPRSWDYLTNIALHPQYALPGVFTDIPYPNAVNGSLWTLPAEFFCYLVVPVLLLWPPRLHLGAFATFLAVSLWLGSLPPDQSPVIYGSRLSDDAGMWVFFAAGALLRLVSVRRPGLFRTDVAVALVGAYAVLISVVPGSTMWIAWIALPYAVLTVGLAETPVVHRAAQFGDLSYGLYLWAFPVQQLVIVMLGVQRMLVDLPIVVAISGVLAYVSWHVVEHPSLRLKDTVIRRRNGELARQAMEGRPAAETLAGS